MPNYPGTKLCGVADHAGSVGCLWPKSLTQVKVFFSGRLGEIDLADAVPSALTGWNQVCGIRLEPHTNHRTANIVISSGNIDGGAGILAMSELPCFGGGAIRQLQQTYDVGEMWTISENPPNNKIDAVRVICHELGHAIGISHINAGNLMAPTYSPSIRWPQRADIMEATVRYGLSPGVPDTPHPDEPTPIPPPGIPVPGDSGWGRLFPCLLSYGIDIFTELTPEERGKLIRIGINLFRRLTPEEKETLENITR